MEIKPGDVLFTFIPEWETTEDCNVTIITKIIAAGENECLVKTIKYLEEEDDVEISSETSIASVDDFEESYIVEKDIWELASYDLENGWDCKYPEIKKRFKELIEYLHS